MKLLEEIKGKSLDELDELMLKFQRDTRDQDSNTHKTSVITVKAANEELDNLDAVSIISDTNSGSIWGP